MVGNLLWEEVNGESFWSERLQSPFWFGGEAHEVSMWGMIVLQNWSFTCPFQKAKQHKNGTSNGINK